MKPFNEIRIRKAEVSDLPAIADIYNYYISHTTATFDTETKDLTERLAWFNDHGNQYPIIVLEKHQQIAGWASVSKWSPRLAYNASAEISVYLKPAEINQGYGNLLIEEIITQSKLAGLHTLIARITQDNDASVYLHKKYGFIEIGVLKEIGCKFNRRLDVTLLQLMLV